MRSRGFWLVVLVIVFVFLAMSFGSNDSYRYASANIINGNLSSGANSNTNETHNNANAPNEDSTGEYPYDNQDQDDDYEEPSQSHLDVQSDSTLVVGRYAGFLSWGHFYHSPTSAPVVVAESSVIDTYTDMTLNISDIIDMEQIEKALALLAEAILAYAPEAAPYLDAINPGWFAHFVMDCNGLRVLLPSNIAPWDLGFVSVILCYEKLGEALLLGVELGIVEPPRRPMVALTFDDGPSIYTNRILDYLEAAGARATFCVLGSRVEFYPETILRAISLGSEVIGHSWNHPNFANLSVAAITAQIADTSAALQAITGSPPPPIIRVPFGIANARERNIARDMGYALLNWSVDPSDWSNRCADHIYEAVMRFVADGSIILLHDIYDSTVEATGRIIQRLLDDGFQLVTATELIEYFYGEIEPGRTYFGRHSGWR